ncbi:MAG: ABC transporter [Bacteroidetes bacterium GWE2_39_28]|nr:MAG: ABC transporter [Bacteroidetes bacterium GWE2_39_28]OFY13321.1 MAG: ABC transporter [Bacteroidetes bacterium GWF2_39_10]OFZ08387.1 MAG: ABC transporter [Bacteroidetes bacterium RIFOXYB2_FULL_39_7]OFZ09750.1 MAG: ABC transporter [Bacteroidetes bacterium RIFOXYC2_FULL_39_11]HCT94982.1 ABC transporter permease [Rikenellaceae bacterium]
MNLNPLKQVLKREIKMMFGRPIYLFSTVFVVAFGYLFFLTLLNEGLPERLPVAVIDSDNSVISRRFARELNTTPMTQVVAGCANFAEARDLMQRGEVYGFIDIPRDFYKDLLVGKRPEVSFYVNNSYLIAGTLSYKDMLTMSTLASSAYQREILRAKGMDEKAIMGRIQPIVIDTHQIGNPWANYGVYLINVLLPGILQLVILLMTVYTIGLELKNKSSREWLAESNGSLAVALSGKLLPYSVIFIILGLAGNVLLYKFTGFPMNGSLLRFSAATVLFVLAHQAIGILMIGLFPVLRVGISFAALYGILSFTYAGFTFPIEAMPPLAQGASVLFPIRHYFNIYVNEALWGTSFVNSSLSYAAIFLFLLLPLIVWNRLKKALINQNYPLK